MKYVKIIPLFFCCLVLAHVLFAEEKLPPGQVGVAPNIFEELHIGSKPVNESIRLYNFKEKPITVRVDAHNWTIDEDNKVKLLPPDPQSLDQWLIINPLSFTVPPKKSQVIRFSIRPRVKPDPGEHRAIIYFTEEKNPEDSTATATLQVLFRIGVGVYATADPVRKKGVLHSFKLDGNKKLSADIENTGNVHIRFGGKFAIWQADTFPGLDNPSKVFPQNKKDKEPPEGYAAGGQLNRFPVLPGARRTITTALPRIEKSGTYIIAVKDTLAGTPRSQIFRLTR
ncbi:MAG: hypothetical protein ISR54_05780 [Chlorobium phaeobacteroides]|uniref:Pili assembly chaperone N-terminal domain-containing protein n=1 Tax=Chlorobium phaeobacteroides (strain BS1) TaxID=331678 RepID=B3EJQ4_CHLPB|nr:hypothetical protein [Chlorobium phaeobacteroides]MBL6956313.1 hypothetical protein [Chlorobium phaeobacteroides]